MPEPKDTSLPEELEIENDITLEELTERLQEELDKVPPEVMAEAREKVKDLLEGEMSWADLTEWTPERLLETAKEGYNRYDTGQFDKAEIIFKGLTVLDPENYYYHQMLGACNQQQDKLPEAIIEYSIAIDLLPEDITSITNRGEVYYQLKLWDLAEKDFDQAIALDPKAENRWANRARLLKKKLAGIKERRKAGSSKVKAEGKGQKAKG